MFCCFLVHYMLGNVSYLYIYIYTADIYTYIYIYYTYTYQAAVIRHSDADITWVPPTFNVLLVQTLCPWQVEGGKSDHSGDPIHACARKLRGCHHWETKTSWNIDPKIIRKYRFKHHRDDVGAPRSMKYRCLNPGTPKSSLWCFTFYTGKAMVWATHTWRNAWKHSFSMYFLVNWYNNVKSQFWILIGKNTIKCNFQ